ncbi:MAG TPA: glycosyltransferase family A protein, partial [Anditalea sp.]|nr:glycosyltransferase family A protein [Anditalea sp.]
MKLSIIISVHNLQEYIGQCLDSVVDIGMSEKDYEIIVVNDGSTDQSWEILGEYKSKFAQIKSYSQENSGVGSARNLGISMARGTYLWIVDGDDMVIPDKVVNAVNIAIMN